MPRRSGLAGGGADLNRSSLPRSDLAVRPAKQMPPIIADVLAARGPAGRPAPRRSEHPVGVELGPRKGAPR
jgi:hypothetical protein